MHTKKLSLNLKPSEITPKEVYLKRREFIANAALLLGGLTVQDIFSPEAYAGQKLQFEKKERFAANEKQTPYKNAANYNNFYEFSTGKEDVAELSRSFKTRPWTLSVEGYVRKPKVYDIDELTAMFSLEERIYRFRCVEAWSMVIPWIGFPLAELIKKCEPGSKAKFVEFTTLYDPKQMPGQKINVIDWPYMEGLRMDEAMHPLAILTVGM